MWVNCAQVGATGLLGLGQMRSETRWPTGAVNFARHGSSAALAEARLFLLKGRGCYEGEKHLVHALV